MNRWARVVGVSSAALTLGLAGEPDAAACGGCFQQPVTQTTTDITDERMLLSVSPMQTTLYDQIRYSGNPASFAWVLPIHGTVDVGLSADVLFDSVDLLTATQITSPAPNCPALPPSNCPGGLSGGGSIDGGVTEVTVTKQANVGPYATVQLHATDSSALETWLSDNGFVIPADVKPVVAQYVAEGFDFLAMKLLPNQGVQSMRPVRVSSPGASLSLPLRMAAIGTGATVGITIWVVSDGRYEPQNFPFYHIDDKDLIWDFTTSSSNYTLLRVKNEAALGGKGWEMESSLNLNEQLISQVIVSGGRYGAGNAPPVSATDDYLAEPADPDGGAEAGAGQTADEVRAADLKALFTGMTGPTVRITRMRSDIAHAAMTTDFVLKASADQSELSNVRVVTQQSNTRCPSSPTCNGSGDDAGTAGGAYGSGGGSDGCATSSRSSGNGSSGLGLVTVGGALALVVARVVRARRRQRKR